MEEAWNLFEDILPPEVTMVVFSHFKLEDIVYISLVCKAWNTYFDTKNIWKQIYDLNFGRVSEKSVDLSQNLRWKRLFFKASLARSWKSEFVKASTAFYCQYPQTYERRFDWLSPNGRYHAVTIEGTVAITDIKMATKLIPVKQHPVSLHSPKSFNLNWENDFKRNVEKNHDMKPPKENYFIMKEINVYNGRTFYNVPGGPGTFTCSANTNTSLVLYNIATHALQLEKNSTPIHLLHPGNDSYNQLVTFNSKFVVYINRRHKDSGAYILDLSKRCKHCCHLQSSNGRYFPEIYTQCTNPKTCAIIEKYPECFLTAFASQANPKKLIFASSGKLSIWTHGVGMQDIYEELRINAGNFSEHVVNIKSGVTRHWLTFTGTQRHFVDLNNTKERIAVPSVTSVAWVPKKSKIALALDKKVTIFDLERKAWCTKLTIGALIRAMLFNTSGNILFVATGNFIHAYLWETGLLVASLPHTIHEEITQLYLAMDQVLVVCTALRSFYMKIKIKLEV